MAKRYPHVTRIHMAQEQYVVRRKTSRRMSRRMSSFPDLMGKSIDSVLCCFLSEFVADQVELFEALQLSMASTECRVD